jgi:hypothetical protein
MGLFSHESRSCFETYFVLLSLSLRGWGLRFNCSHSSHRWHRQSDQRDQYLTQCLTTSCTQLPVRVPKCFFSVICSAISSARTSSLVYTFFSKNSRSEAGTLSKRWRRRMATFSSAALTPFPAEAGHPKRAKWLPPQQRAKLIEFSLPTKRSVCSRAG